MSWLPDWIENAKNCIAETIDDGLDIVRDGTQTAIDYAHNVQNIVKENTWSIVHVPVNAVISVATLPCYIPNGVATVIDDYLFENEKREIKQVEQNFIQSETQNVEQESKKSEQLDDEAQKYAEDNLKSLLNKASQTNMQKEPMVQTLKEMGESVLDDVNIAVVSNQYGY